jgi:hypothetical protein
LKVYAFIFIFLNPKKNMVNLSAVINKESAIVNLTANNQIVPNFGGSYLRVSSNSSVLDSRIFTVEAGENIGQTLYLEVVGSNTCKLSGTDKHLKTGDILFLIWNGSGWKFVSEVSSLFQKENPDYRIFDDFNGIVASDHFLSSNAGTGSGNSNINPATLALRAGRIGFRQSSVGTTATGRAGLTAHSGTILFDETPITFEQDFYFPILPTATEDFNFFAGFNDNITETTIVDGVYFRYSLSSPNLIAVTKNNTVATPINTGFAVLANTWVRARVEVTSLEAKFFINNNLVATITSNIPSAIGRETGYGYMLNKTAGTGARVVISDFIDIFKELKR